MQTRRIMAKKRTFTFTLLFSCLSILGNAQQETRNNDTIDEKNTFFATKYIVPTTLVVYGVTTRFSKSLQDFDHNIHEKIKNNVSKKYTFDDYLQYAPPLVIYTLKLSGVKSEHNLRDQTIVMTNAYLISGLIAQGIKRTTQIARPNDGSKNSFPSGHTTTAFVGAHILYKEYKNTSPWIGVCGYVAATTVGSFRMINQRHWLSDVVTGAGIGILCAELSYVMLPFYQRLFGFKENNKGVEAMTITPFIGSDFYALGLTLKF